MQDIQAIEPAMARLLAWIDGIDLPMFVLRLLPSDRLEFVHANSALGRVAGIPTTILPRHTAAEIFPSRLAKQLEENYRTCLTSFEPFSYEECIRIEERETWWQTTLSKPAGFNGNVVLGVAIPITDRKRQEFATAEAMADMTARFDELHLFSTVAAHDARSPLATVSSLVDLVLEDFEDMGDGKVDLLRMVSNTVEEALSQISATLERARALQSNNETVSQVDLGRLCGNIATMVDPETSLEIDVPQAFVECDEVVVQMGLRNLMSNAARFCRSRIAVTIAEDRKRGMLMIDLADDGPGLPKRTTLQDLTAKGEARDGVNGFGLCAIAKLVHSRGGALELAEGDTVSGLSGARFRMVLPGKIIARGTAPMDRNAVPEGPPMMAAKYCG